MSNNSDMVRKQILRFNKYMSRHQENISDKSYEIVTDLIGKHLTASGYGKAGKKYLSQMSEFELQSYSAAISSARQLIEMQSLEGTELVEQLAFEEDPKSGLWKMFQALQDKGHPFDSDQVKAIADGDVEAPYVETLIEMSKVLNDSNYGLSDFTEWFNSRVSL